MISDQIIERCKRNEQSAFKLCYERCAPYIYTITKSYISDQDLRKDAMQEIFANIFTSLNTFDNDKGKFKSWIAQIAIYQCIGILRKRKKLSAIVALDDKHKELKESNVDLDNLSRIEIEKLLEKMPVGYKTVFLLSVIDDYPHKEIAKILNITKETSRSQLSRAIRWIKHNKIVNQKNFTYG